MNRITVLKLFLKIIGCLLAVFVVIHLVALVCAAFHFFVRLPQALGVIDGTLFLIFMLTCIAFLCFLPFLIFWSFIVAIIGLGVRAGMSGQNREARQ